MPFLLKRGGENEPLEVQRWQYFLLKNQVTQVGSIDAQFGGKTEEGTKIFQIQRALPVTGELDQATLEVAQGLGYTVRPDNFYDTISGPNFPPRPNNLTSPSNHDRNKALGCFRFRQLPIQNRGDPDEIVTEGSCDGVIADWRMENIIDLPIPQMKFASGFSGVMRCHRLAAPHILLLFARWEQLDLLHLIRRFDGAYVPRYKRGQSPGPGGHGIKRSDQTDAISNHGFGAAFDINEPDNPFGHVPRGLPAAWLRARTGRPRKRTRLLLGRPLQPGERPGRHAFRICQVLIAGGPRAAGGSVASARTIARRTPIITARSAFSRDAGLYGIPITFP